MLLMVWNVAKALEKKKEGRSRILTSKPQAINPFALCQHQQLPEYTKNHGTQRNEKDLETEKIENWL